MLFLLVFRCGKHKVRPDDNATNHFPTSSLFASSTHRSIYMVMMRMEAEKIQQQIKACVESLITLERGQVYASDTPLYSLGDSMAFVELSYANALDAIQQRDNDMAGQWLDMAKLTQEYIKVLTRYLEQDALPQVEEKCDVAVPAVLAEPIDHMAEPGLEEWSHAAVLDFQVHDSSSSSIASKKKASWYMDPIVTKKFSQKHVQEDAREDVYDLVIVDLAPTAKDGREAVDDLAAAFDETMTLPWEFKSASTTSRPSNVFEPTNPADNDNVTAPVWKAFNFFESGGCPGMTSASERSHRPHKLSQAWPPVR